MKLASLFLVVLGIMFDSMAQKKYYRMFYNEENELVDSTHAVLICDHVYFNEKADSGYVIERDVDLSVNSISKYYSIQDSIKNGSEINFYQNGDTLSIFNYKMDTLDGSFKTYYLKNRIKRIDQYHKGEVIEGKCFSKNGCDTTYYDYTIMPKSNGGEEALYRYISKKFVVSKKAIRKNISGKVFVSFVIDQKGKVEKVKILKSVHPELDNEAIRVMSNMPLWKPGFVDGDPVKVRYAIPIDIRYK